MGHRISFITPVYNGEKFIERSAASVLSEKGQDFELLIVDDGSTDRTGQICDDIASKDARVRVFHTENHGQSLARNLGMKNSDGDYFAFVDADDELVWDGMHQLIRAVDEHPWDVVCGNYYMDVGGKTFVAMTDVPSGEIVHSQEKGTLYQKIKTRSTFGYCCNKLYRRIFLEENGLELDDIRKVYMEDALFNLKVFSKKPSYFYCDSPMFIYHIQNESASRRSEPKIAEKYIALYHNYGEYLEREGNEAENMDLAIPLAMRIFCWSLFSNIRYEGLDTELMKHRIRVFLDDPYFSRAMHDRSNIHYISFIPSLPQRVMYRLCFLLLSCDKIEAITMIFTVLYPFMKFYADHLQVK